MKNEEGRIKDDLIKRQNVMKKRNLSEMVAFFNCKVSEMKIPQKYKMELLGMITAIEMKHDELMLKWIPVTEAMPINDVDVIVSVLDDSGDTPYRFTSVGWCTPNGQYWVVDNEMCYGVIAWQPLPEPWRGDR